MRCPFCRDSDSRVVDSREAEDGSIIRRRRACTHCGRRFTTLETSALVVVKRSGVREPFDRDKVLGGVRKACQGRPVTDDDLAVLGQQVEETVRGSGAAEISSHDVGLAVLAPLRRLDEVAYLRFASVYRAFDSLAEFEAEIAMLRDGRRLAGEPSREREPAPVRLVAGGERPQPDRDQPDRPQSDRDQSDRGQPYRGHADHGDVALGDAGPPGGSGSRRGGPGGSRNSAAS